MNIRASLDRLRLWSREHKKATYIIISGVVVLLGSVTAFALLYQKPDEPTSNVVIKEPEPKPEPVKYYSLLTGEQVENEAALTAPVTTIMLENSPDARPQSGIKDAGVVYEAIAEGGITRFLAVYQHQKPQLIGPVRSLRMYYLDWAAPYNGSIAHVGGSAAALAEVRNGNYRDIDQFFNGASYWRATDRYAPHNVYTSFQKIDELNSAEGYTQSTFTSFPRTDGSPAAEPDATSIVINFSSPTYNTTYLYNKECNCYDRSQGGEAHTDREAGQISPTSVIALRVTMEHILEDGYREHITTTGSGSAVLFQNGTAQEVTWHKADRTSPLVITDSAGKDIALVRGQTWIAAVPTSGGGGISWQP